MVAAGSVCPQCEVLVAQELTHCGNCGSPLLIGRVCDAFQILECLGGGGMGSVFRARYLDDSRVAAVKFLRYGPLQNTKNRARFLREVQLTSRLHHPNIVSILDFGRVETFGPYMVMDYLNGIPLSQSLHKEIALPWPQALHIAGQICRAMQFAHENGVIHRDLKPANMFLQRSKELHLPFVKIVDFGIAKSLEGDLVRMTQTGSLLGTPIYMSPEQVRRADTDERTDIYTLGIVLFQMLSGSLPFDGGSAMAILMKRLASPAPKLSSFQPAYRGTQIEMIVAKCLNREPARRFASMAVLLKALHVAYQEMIQLSEIGRFVRREDVDDTTEGKLFSSHLLGGPMPANVPEPLPTWETETSQTLVFETLDDTPSQ